MRDHLALVLGHVCVRSMAVKGLNNLLDILFILKLTPSYTKSIFIHHKRLESTTKLIMEELFTNNNVRPIHFWSLNCNIYEPNYYTRELWTMLEEEIC